MCDICRDNLPNSYFSVQEACHPVVLYKNFCNRTLTCYTRRWLRAVPRMWSATQPWGWENVFPIHYFKWGDLFIYGNSSAGNVHWYPWSRSPWCCNCVRVHFEFKSRLRLRLGNGNPLQKHLWESFYFRVFLP